MEEENKVHGEHHWQTLSHNVVSSKPPWNPVGSGVKNHQANIKNR